MVNTNIESFPTINPPYQHRRLTVPGFSHLHTPPKYKIPYGSPFGRSWNKFVHRTVQFILHYYASKTVLRNVLVQLFSKLNVVTKVLVDIRHNSANYTQNISQNPVTAFYSVCPLRTFLVMRSFRSVPSAQHGEWHKVSKTDFCEYGNENYISFNKYMSMWK